MFLIRIPFDKVKAITILYQSEKTPKGILQKGKYFQTTTEMNAYLRHFLGHKNFLQDSTINCTLNCLWTIDSNLQSLTNS